MNNIKDDKDAQDFLIKVYQEIAASRSISEALTKLELIFRKLNGKQQKLVPF